MWRLAGMAIFVLLFLNVTTCDAAGFTLFVDGLPTSIDDRELELNVSFAGDPRYYADHVYFLRGVFSPLQTTKYFGFTQNNMGEWIETSDDKSRYFGFTTSSEGSWSGKLKVKTNLSSTNFTGNGDYQFKIGRFTSATDTSADWAFEQTISLVGPTPSPTPTALVTNTPTVSSAPSIVTHTQAPTRTPSQVPTSTPVQTVLKKTPVQFTITPTMNSTVAATSTSSAVTGEDNYDLVLGESTQVTITPTATATETKKSSAWYLVFIVTGGLMMLVPGIRFILHYQRKALRVLK